MGLFVYAKNRRFFFVSKSVFDFLSLPLFRSEQMKKPYSRTCIWHRSKAVWPSFWRKLSETFSFLVFPFVCIRSMWTILSVTMHAKWILIAIKYIWLQQQFVLVEPVGVSPAAHINWFSSSFCLRKPQKGRAFFGNLFRNPLSTWLHISTMRNGFDFKHFWWDRNWKDA